MGTKDFGLIADDYSFFMAHATEAERDAAQYARELTVFEQRRPTRMFDFGCGTGAFTERLLLLLDWPPEALELALAEPVREQRAEAAQRLSRFTRHAIETIEAPLAGCRPRFDVVVANHVLYYVEDLAATLEQLSGSVAPGGKLLLAIAGWDNPLLGLWRTGFGLLGQPVPYYASEDVDAWLRQSGTAYRRTAVPYRLRFPDSAGNRRKILRFLFGEHFAALPEPRLLAEFDGYVAHGNVEIDTSSDHYVVEVS